MNRVIRETDYHVMEMTILLHFALNYNVNVILAKYFDRIKAASKDCLEK